MTMRCKTLLAVGVAISLGLVTATLTGSSQPVRARHGMVVAQERLATEAGRDVLRAGGSAVDSAVATAFVLAVTHPTAGNIGGGGFMIVRPATGEPVAYDFRESAPAAASPAMFLVDGTYDRELHHDSHVAVGVPGTVAGLHLAWSEHGRLPWSRLVRPAIELAEDGFVATEHLARSLADVLPRMARYPASVEQFSRGGIPYEAGDIFRQPALAETLALIAEQGPAGFYRGPTAELIEREMQANDGLITQVDLAGYRARRRDPLTGTYRGYEVISMPPISSGGTALIQMLNTLEGYDLAASGHGSAQTVHVVAEAMQRAYADRARFLGDPDFNPMMPIERLISKPYADQLRHTIRGDRTSTSSPTSFAGRGQIRIRPDKTLCGRQLGAGVEVTHFVVEQKPRAGHDDPRAVALLERERHRHGVTVRVDHREVGRLLPFHRPLRQADAVEHDAHDRDPGRPPVHAHRQPRRTHHHQHRPPGDHQRHRFRNEYSGSGRRATVPSPVAA